MKHRLFVLLMILAVPCIGQSPDDGTAIAQLYGSTLVDRVFGDDREPGEVRSRPGRLEREFAAAEREGDKRKIALLSNRLGLYHAGRQAFDVSIPYFEKSLAAQHFLGDQGGLAVAAFELGYAHYRLAQFDKALQYLYSSIEASGEAHMGMLTALAQGVAGFSYLHKGDTIRGERFVDRSERTFIQSNDPGRAAQLLNKTAEYFILLDDYRRANAYLSRIYKLKGAGAEYHARAARNEGVIRFREDEFEMAILKFDSSLAYARNPLVRKLKKDAYLKLAAYYSFQNNFTKADSCHSAYLKLKESIRSFEGEKTPAGRSRADEEAEKRTIIGLLSREPVVTRSMPSQQGLELSQRLTVEELERRSKERALEELNLATIENKEKEKEVALLSREKALQELALSENKLELSRKTALSNALIGGSLVFLLVIFFLYSRYSYKKKANTELNKSNEGLKKALEQLRSTQEQLVYSRKMASLGEMAAGIAHEIKNPLNFVNNFSSFSNELLEEIAKASPEERGALEEELRVNLSKINEHGRRADQIVRNMQLLSRHSSGERQPADIRRLLESDLKLAYSGFHAGHPAFECRFDTRIGDGLPEALVNIQDMSRVFINVISNGLYAMHLRGKAGDGHQAVLTTRVDRDAGMLVIRIRDNGTGIPEKIREKIFDPFFTTKPAGTGAGLGLSISFDIVKAHGGEIDVISEERAFTEVVLKIPVAG